MGLDNFKTSSSSSSPNSSSSSSSGVTVSKSEYDEVKRPHFTAIEKKETENVIVYTGDKAFPESARHRDERVLVTIQDEEEFNRIDSLCKDKHGKGIVAFFEENPGVGLDFIERFKTDGDKSQVENCPVCDDMIDVKKDDYTVVNGETVHSDHKMIDVAEHLDIE